MIDGQKDAWVDGWRDNKSKRLKQGFLLSCQLMLILDLIIILATIF